MCIITKYEHCKVANAFRSAAWVPLVVTAGCARRRCKTRIKSMKHTTERSKAMIWILWIMLDRMIAEGVHQIRSSGLDTPLCFQCPSLAEVLLSPPRLGQKPSTWTGPHIWQAILAKKPSVMLANWTDVDHTSSDHEGQSSAFMTTASKNTIDSHSAYRAAWKIFFVKLVSLHAKLARKQ